MSSWNRATSYAANVKLRNFVPHELSDKAYEILEQGDVFQGAINPLIDEWGAKHGYRYQAGFNGRSGGYLVLYQGEAKPSQYKSRCVSCGQRNCTSVKENSTKCGACGQMMRMDYETPPLEISTRPGLGLDMERDFSEWTLEDLKARVKLIKDFDALVQSCKDAFLDYCRSFTVEEEEIQVTKKIKVLREIA